MESEGKFNPSASDPLRSAAAAERTAAAAEKDPAKMAAAEVKSHIPPGATDAQAQEIELGQMVAEAEGTKEPTPPPVTESPGTISKRGK